MMKRTTRKQKGSPPKEEAKQTADEKKLKVDTLKVDNLIKELPIDVQGEILDYLGAAYEVRKGKLIRKTLRMSGKIQSRLLDSMPQMMSSRFKPLQLNLKTVPMENRNRNIKSWSKIFDHPKLLGSRSLQLVEDSNDRTPSYRYRSYIDGQDAVEINTPMNNDTVLEPFIKRHYPSYPFTGKKLGKNQTLKAKTPLFNPTIPNTGYNPPRRAYRP